MKKKLFFLTILILLACVFSTYAYEGDTYILKNYRTSTEYIVRADTSSNIPILIDNAINGDTFSWFAKDNLDNVVQTNKPINIISDYCVNGGSSWVKDKDLEDYTRGKAISYNEIQYKYYIKYSSTPPHRILYRNDEIKVIK